MNVRSKCFAFVLCALSSLTSYSCSARSGGGGASFDDDVPDDRVSDAAPPDKLPSDVAPLDVAPLDVPTPDVAPPDVAPLDVAPLDVAPLDVAPLDVAPDELPSDVAPDVVADVARDTSCRTRCSGFCSDPDVDLHNCGLCGNDCTLRAGVDGTRVACVAGACVFTGACLPGRANCSGHPDDGCETLVTTAARCGTCSTACVDPTPNCGRRAGVPGGYACTSDCVDPLPTRCGAVCVDTMTDPLHCGACGNACPTGLRGTPLCLAGRCALACETGYRDCDGNLANGCETPTSTSVTNCGACGNVCPPGPGSSPVCSAGTCTLACTAGTGNCDMNAANGCETDTRTSPVHCGACNTACGARPNGNSTCVASACALTCNAGFGNCNAVVSDGCESDFATDPLNCGACARRCATAANSTPTCTFGACGTACSAGFGDCDGNGLNGCEVSLTADARNCGACGTGCATGQYCVRGVCDAMPPLYHGWTCPIAGCVTTGYNTTARTNLGGNYPFNTGDSNACRAWKLAATVCTTAPVAYYGNDNWSCPNSGGFSDPAFGTFCAVANQYSCSTCPAACNAMCAYTPLSLRNCAGTEASQP